MEASMPTMPYLPFVDHAADAFRWRLGLRPLDLEDWIELGPGADALIAAKPDVMARHPATAFVALDGVEPEAQEVADALLDHVRHRWPERYGEAGLDPDLHPLDAAARLVPEDLVLMVERDGRLVFGAGSVCAPNRWDLRSKLGRTLQEVHAPVPQLNAQLADPVDRFLTRLSPERSFWRLGWGLIDTADPYAAVDGTAPRPVGVGPDEHHLRVERETLRRFPRTGAVLFTIRTYISAVTELPPDVALALADSIAGLPDDVAGYKELTDVGAALELVLRARSGGANPKS